LSIWDGLLCLFSHILSSYLISNCWILLGEIISDDEDEGEEEGDDGDDDEDTYMKKQREKLEAEKEAILNNKNLIAEVWLAYML